MEQLRADGYGIEGDPRHGYRLVARPPELFPEEIILSLRGRARGVRWQPIWFAEVGSTSDEAKGRAGAGEPEGTLVVAERQSAGRGRRGRAWESPSGGLWFSLILRPGVAPRRVAAITLVMAEAVAEAIEEVAGLSAGIKWPNDVLVGAVGAEKKVAGILTEMASGPERVEYLVVGVGVDVDIDERRLPAELGTVATSLSAVAGRKIDRTALLASMLDHIGRFYQEFLEGAEAELVARWRRRSLTLGRTVRVETGGEVIEGRATAIDAEGCLVVETDGGPKVFAAGDVAHLR